MFVSNCHLNDPHIRHLVSFEHLNTILSTVNKPPELSRHERISQKMAKYRIYPHRHCLCHKILALSAVLDPLSYCFLDLLSECDKFDVFMMKAKAKSVF